MIKRTKKFKCKPMVVLNYSLSIKIVMPNDVIGATRLSRTSFFF